MQKRGLSILHSSCNQQYQVNLFLIPRLLHHSVFKSVQTNLRNLQAYSLEMLPCQCIAHLIQISILSKIGTKFSARRRHPSAQPILGFKLQPPERAAWTVGIHLHLVRYTTSFSILYHPIWTILNN